MEMAWALFKSGSHEKWLRAIHNVGNPDFAEKGGGAGGPPPQEKVKLARFGFNFAAAFAPLVENGSLSEINLYRSSGLKPKFQKSYFGFAQSLTADELQEHFTSERSRRLTGYPQMLETWGEAIPADRFLRIL